MDDEGCVIEMVSQVMEWPGYRVISHTSSIEALNEFKDDPDKFDLVLTDMLMPEMTGDQLAQKSWLSARLFL